MRINEHGDGNMRPGGAGGLSDGPAADPGREEPGTGPVDLGGAQESSAKEAAGSFLGRLGDGAANAGWGVAAVGYNLVRGGKNAGERIARQVAAKATMWGGKLALSSGGLLTAKMGTTIVAGAMAVTPVAGVYGVNALLSSDDRVKFEGLPQTCEELKNQADTVKGAGLGVGDGDAEYYAQQVYSILSYAGMGDENIAGILGNFQVESGGGMDPTAVERIFDEPYRIGPRKQAMWDNDFNPQPTGIGLAQWTAERTYQLLDFADEKNSEWHELDVHMAFAMSADSGAEIFQQRIANESPGSDDPGDAANFFLRKWERPADPDGNEPVRRKHASEWYAKMGAWDVDSALGRSVLDMAEVSGGVANNKSLQRELAGCPELGGGASGGNEDAAMAMVSISWPNYDDSKGNDGTDLYQHVFGEILEGDPYKASCDRTVATAVLWSGSDDTFPKGAVSQQLAYVNGEGKDKWEKVSGNSEDESNLRPGDVLITKGHILMYVGPDAVAEVYSDGDHTPDAVIGHGSLNDRSPALDSFGGVTGDSRPYQAYRLKSPEKNSKFKDIDVPANLKPGQGNPNGGRTTPGAG